VGSEVSSGCLHVSARPEAVSAYGRLMSLVTGYEDVQAVLADGRYAVPAPPPPGPVGSVSWLRASVCRFANGELHDVRLSAVLEQLAGLSPAALRSDARDRGAALLSEGRFRGGASEAHEVLSRPVPMETLAAAMGFPDPRGTATHVIALAGGYFPGSSPEAESRADAGLAALLAMIGSEDSAVPPLTIMVQACEATAALISRSLASLEAAGDAAGTWSSEALLAEVVRHWPPAPVCRRQAKEDITERGVTRGDEVLCDIESANHDPAVFASPELFDPHREQPPNLTFGSGIRPCPARPEALALASGVIDAWRECYGPSGQAPRPATNRAGRRPRPTP